MSSNESLSPEEKLLKVIQQGKAPGAAPAEGSPAAPPKVSPAALAAEGKPPAAAKAGTAPPPTGADSKLKLAPAAPSPAAAPEAPAPAKAEAEPPPPIASRGRPALSVGLVNRFLLVAVVLLVLAVVYDFALAKTGPARSTGEGGTAFVPAGTSIVPTGELVSYLAKFSQRNVFIPVAAAAVVSTDTVGVVAEVVKPVDLQNYRLLGVSIDSRCESNSMAIIENVVTKDPYFVRCGETLGSTDLVLLRVLEDRILLRGRRGEMELR